MNEKTDKFDILRQLAVAGSRGEDLAPVSEQALRQAAELLALAAGALYLWDDQFKVTVSVAWAASETGQERLQSLEDDLFSGLRQDKQLVAAYMSFAGDYPCHSFTLPLRHGKRVFGAVIGLQEGEGSIVSEDQFLEALAASLALNYVAGRAPDAASSSVTDEALQKEKLAGITETAVTVNHEINSPLTAILGNVQLLLRDRDDLDKELVTKLKTIEQSAERIQETTHRLLRVTAPRTIQYAEGIRMLDLSDKDKKE